MDEGDRPLDHRHVPGAGQHHEPSLRNRTPPLVCDGEWNDRVAITPDQQRRRVDSTCFLTHVGPRRIETATQERGWPVAGSVEREAG